MPHKRNPMVCEAIFALARLVTNGMPSAFDAMMQEHERDLARQHIEWSLLPEACVMTDGALALLTRVLQGLHVNPKRMAKNLEQLDGLILSEAVMLALAEKVGRQSAHDIVYECSMRAVEQARPFRETLAENAIVQQYLSPQDVETLLDVNRYTGLSAQFVDRVVDGNVSE